MTIASNTNPLHLDHIEQRFPIVKQFARRALSYQLGVVKPHRAFFERALEVAGRSASECFFVDDREENVRGARAAGIDAEVFKGEQALFRELSRRGIPSVSRNRASCIALVAPL